MKKFKLVYFVMLLIIVFGVFGCGGNGGVYQERFWKPLQSGNEFNEITENPFLLVSEHPTSSFAMDSSTAAYSNIRRYINNEIDIDKNMVRIEEMVNYFKYSYALPENGKDLSVDGTISPCPWNSEAKLLTVGVRAQDIEFKDIRNNLVFLLDVSSSMNRHDKMPLMQAAFKMLSENLNDEDCVSVVTYAGTDKIILSGSKGSYRKIIQNVIEDLSSYGYTAGVQGIKTAYDLCQDYFIEGGNNRVILATDGDFNVGINSQSELKEFIEEKRSTNIGLTVLGFGYGNLKDNKLETLANSAYSGNYAYIDNLLEARKALVEEIGGTLVTVAKDVKAQVEFNPSKVYAYRLLGYENKLMAEDEWDDSDKIAGDIGAGHCVTAVYEIVLNKTGGQDTMNGSFSKISLRYKAFETNKDTEISVFVNAVSDLPNDDIKFISAVVEAALIMRDSKFKGSASLQNVINRLESIRTLSSDPYKTEFLELMKKYRKSWNGRYI